MIYAHKYRIIYWDEFENKMTTEKGIAFGETFSEVMENLEKYYGEPNIEEIKLSGYDIGSDYVLPEEELETLGFKAI